MSSTELTRKISWPPGRSSRAASGIQAYGSHQMLAPYSEIARSKLASANGACSALPCTSGNRCPKRSWSWRAVASCAAELSSPAGQAPRRASQAETYPVPQPSSILSRPSRSPASTPAFASVTFQMPHAGSGSAHMRKPGSAYSAASRSHAARLRRT